MSIWPKCYRSNTGMVTDVGDNWFALRIPACGNWFALRIPATCELVEVFLRILSKSTI